MKKQTITDKYKIHKGEPTPRVSPKPKVYRVKSTDHRPMAKPEQGDCGPGGLRAQGAPPKKKLKVTKSDKDFRAVGARQGYDGKLFSKFPQSEHVKGRGGPGTGRSTPSRSSSKPKRAKSKASPESTLGAATAAVTQAFAPLARPGFGEQPVSGYDGDPRGVGGPLHVRATRDVR